MKHLNRFQNWIVWVCKIKPFDVNKALWDKYHQGKQAGLEEGRKEKPDCLICPLYKNAHPHEIAYEPPSPTTEGKLAAQHRDNKPDWWKRRNPHLVDTYELPRTRATRDLRYRSLES